MMKQAHIFLGVLAAAGCSTLVLAQPGSTGLPERRVLLPADFQGVTLLDGSLKRQLDDAKEYYLRIPNDDLLLGFRRRAGRPAPGRELGGWYSSDTFHVFGQILSGLARLYAATGDPACKAKADALHAEWAACIAPDGFFYYTEHPNAPHYTYDKMVGGLVDLARYAGNQEAPASLARITDWALKNLDRSNVYAFNAGQGSTEWYTLSENLYRAYLLTNDAKYRDFAGAWEYTDYWNLYANGKDIFAARADGKQTASYHAYSHVNTLGGAALAYIVKGERPYLATLTGAYDSLQANQCFATGGYGPNECLLPAQRLPEMLRSTHNTFETQCGSWAGFKLAKHLITLTGDARYGDWVESLAINALGATIPMNAAGGVMYYSDYNVFGAAKRSAPDGWSCCTGTRPMALADLADQIYFRSEGAVSVNLYVPSRFQTRLRNYHVTITQTTRFPEEQQAQFTLALREPTPMKLAFRRPAWLSAPMKATINGRDAAFTEDPGSWLSLQRTWNDADRVVVTLPADLRSVPLGPRGAFPTAIALGPTVLALRSAHGNPGRQIEFEHLAENFIASPGEALTFHLRSDPGVLARPFYACKEGEEYFVYFDPALPDRLSHHQVNFQGQWQESPNFRYSNGVGATAEASFEGTRVRWLGFAFDDAGQAEVRIDGTLVAVVDQYAPGRDLAFDWRSDRLRAGKHTIALKIIPEKSAASKDRFINVAGFEISHDK